MTVAVIGAGGFIGQHLTRALAGASLDVLPISSSQDHCFDAATGILADGFAADRPLGAVVFLSQSPRYRNVPEEGAHLWGVNVVSAIKAAEWARRCGARRFVYASSGTIYRPSFSPLGEDAPLRRDAWYPLSKIQAEEALALYGRDLRVTCARLFGVYGPGQEGKLIPRMIDAVRRGRPVELQPHPTDSRDDGGLRLSLTYIDDVVRVLMALTLEDAPPTLNLAGNDVRSIRDIAEVVGGQLGVEPQFERTASAREGDLVADNTRLTSVWHGAFTTFEQGMGATIQATVAAAAS